MDDASKKSFEAGLAVLKNAATEIAALEGRHDGTALCAAADLIVAAQARSGRVHVTGIGKAEHIAVYGAAHLSSVGCPATFLHATEALHGSLGQIVEGDVVIVLSNSGETPEILLLADALERCGAPLVAVTGNTRSRLAGKARVILDAGVTREGGPLGLAPRASVATQVLVIAALGAILQDRQGLTKNQYGDRHPGGKLGARARS